MQRGSAARWEDDAAAAAPPRRFRAGALGAGGFGFWRVAAVAGHRRGGVARDLARALPGVGADPVRLGVRRRRRRTGRSRLSAHVAQHGVGARLRRAHQGLQGAGGEQDRPGVAVGLDPAAADRRRQQRDALDPARHRRRHPRQRPEQDQRRVRLSAGRRWPSARSRVPRHPGQPPRRGQLRELPAADRRARRRRSTGAAASSRGSTAASRTAATRCG